jgi:hypothetical protein
MRRLGIALGGLVTGAGLGLLVGGCSGYFECKTIEHPLEPGTYHSSSASSGYTLVLGADGVAVETYTDTEGEVRAEYSVATPAPLP